MKLVQQKYFLFANSWSLRTTSVLFFGQTRIYQMWNRWDIFVFSQRWGWVAKWSRKIQIPIDITKYELVALMYICAMCMLIWWYYCRSRCWSWCWWLYCSKICLLCFIWIFSLNTCDVGTDYVYYDERYKRLWYWHSKWITTFIANIINASCDI